MTERHEPKAANTQPSPASPSEMRLRSDRAPITRLSRKVLLGLAGLAVTGIAAMLVFALRPNGPTGRSELYNTANRSTPDGLTALPKSYADLPKPTPRLGPPLPGDFGKPMLNAGMTSPIMPAAASADQQRRLQELQAARASKLFATTDVNASRTASPQETSVPTPAAAATTTSISQNTDHKTAFLNAPPERRTLSTEQLQSPPSPDVIEAGTIIPAALITGLRSDLPGEITAQVTQNVYDTPTGNILLVPQGSKLVGEYDAQISFGQSRALLVWNRLILPNGKSIVLERQPGTDTEGHAGLEDQVDNHWGALFKAAVLSTVLSVGAEAGTSNSENNLAQAIRQGASQSFSQTGEQIVGRSLNVQPTITIRPGFPVDVLVTRDLILERYREM